MLPQVNPEFKPTVLIFDIDETVSTNYVTEDEYICCTPTTTNSYITPLCPAAESELCTDRIGHFHLEENLWMHAIAREKFKKIFDRIYEIQTTQKKNCPIAVKIITRGNYTTSEVMSAWDQFYGENDKRFTNGNVRVEFFNRYSFKKNGVFIGESLDGSVYKKHKLMLEHFPRWQEEMPGLKKSRVCLIDDNYDTTLKVCRAGFSAIHFPTVRDTTPWGVCFLEECPKAFAMLHQFIDTAVGEKYLEAEEKSKLESDECSNSEEFLNSDEDSNSGFRCLIS